MKTFRKVLYQQILYKFVKKPAVFVTNKNVTCFWLFVLKYNIYSIYNINFRSNLTNNFKVLNTLNVDRNILLGANM